MKNEKLAVLFKKYLNGECTSEEMQTIEQWYQSHDGNPDDDRLVNTEDVKSLEDKILGRIKNEISAQNDRLHMAAKKSSPFSFYGFYKVAASLLLFGLVGAAAYLYTRNNMGKALGKAASEVSNGIEKITNV
ncbi:MAG: hypothetical protein C0490_25670, partial [Marivirga sp.]|nr:hypothetical protein [Marivirga sp.]